MPGAPGRVEQVAAATCQQRPLLARTWSSAENTGDAGERIVLGVMPQSFTFCSTAAQAWMLLTPDSSPPPAKVPTGIFARLRPGVTIEQAQTEVSAIRAALQRSDGQGRDLTPLVAELHGEFTFLAEARLRQTLSILLAAVGFVLRSCA